MLLDCGQVEWDSFLPQLMRGLRGTPHCTTGETANFMMFGQKLRLPNSLVYNIPSSEESPVQDYIANLLERMKAAHKVVRAKQKEIRTKENQSPYCSK